MFELFGSEVYNISDNLEQQQQKEAVNELAVIEKLNISNSALTKCTVPPSYKQNGLLSILIKKKHLFDCLPI